MGHDGIEYYIHQGFLSGLSAPLNDLVNEIASTEGCVIWGDVSEDTFSRFAQFVYTGTYTGFGFADRDDTIRHSEEPTSITTNVFGNLPDSSSTREPLGLFSIGTSTPEPLQNTENDVFKLPYSLVSYQVAATEWVPSHSMKSGSRQSSKRKFDAIACNWDLGRKKCPSNNKLDFIQAFTAKHGDLTSTSSFFGFKQISNKASRLMR